MRKRQFEALVREAIESIPDSFLDIMINVDFQVRRWPLSRHLAGLEPGETLLGLYEGYPITDAFDGNMAQPDIITIFQGPIEEICDTNAQVRTEVRDTVVHEVAHFFGISDAELHAWGLA